MHSIKKYKMNQTEVTFIEVKYPDFEVTVMDYGATILSIFTKDEKGTMENVVMAYDNMPMYENNSLHLNATVGPTSGRIKNGAFLIDKTLYQIDQNFLETENLHGGKDTLSFKTFDYEVKEHKDHTKVIFTYQTTPDSMYPGVQVYKITYTVYNGKLVIDFEGDTTEDTLMNLTNHAYFNLGGDSKYSVLDHDLQINADYTMRLDEKMVPYSRISVDGSHLDFRKNAPIRDHFYDGIYDSPEYGIDNPLILAPHQDEDIIATLYDPVSKRQMTVQTTYDTVVVFTDNFPGDTVLMHQPNREKHMGICFETQHVPNGVNIEGEESGILRKNKHYHHQTTFSFSIKG